jgi:molecular chaperone DnaK (HSP70)
MNTYFIGIDLGTSNTLCAYLDTTELRQLTIPQPRDANTIIRQELLPSFCALPDDHESLSKMPLPKVSGKWIPGEFAKRLILETPERVLHSAKSWLSVASIDRTSPILPWNSPIPESDKLSPLTVQSIYLSYIKKIFEDTISPEAFSNARIVITVPASFDEEACHLTKQAATQAHFPEHTLFLDEPQAALFANIELVQQYFKNKTTERPLILVCDVGGGTTDFSLYSYNKKKVVPFERVKIGRHLLLGGDNIDVAIAQFIKDKVDIAVSEDEFRMLIQESRALKEAHFSSSEIPESVRISVSGRGSNLFTATKTFDVPLQEVLSFVENGFFPLLNTINKNPDSAAASNTTPISEFGLPLEEEPAITQHLYTFLDGVHLDAVLFNGGTMECSAFRKRVISFIEEVQGYAPGEIQSSSLSHSVARGATRYLEARSKGTPPVTAGYPRSLYLLAEDNTEVPKAVCILQKGEERDEWISVPSSRLSLLLATKCNFTLLSRSNYFDAPGTVHIPDTSFQVLSQLEASITPVQKSESKKIEVSLDVKISSLRIIEIRLKDISGTETFPLLFKGRVTDLIPSASNDTFELPEAVSEYITALYGSSSKKATNIAPQHLLKNIEKVLSQTKKYWSMGILRSIADLLLPVSSKRSRSAAHEIAWLHLCGYCLRPGFGATGDDSRLSAVEKTKALGLFFKKEKNTQSAWAIFWRRVAGGLPASLQEELFNETLTYVRKNKFLDPEHIRLLSSLEKVSGNRKSDLLETLFTRCATKSNPSEAELWAIARLVSRHSISQDDALLLPVTIATEYIKKATEIKLDKNRFRYFLRMLLVSQQERGDKFDIPLAVREMLIRSAAKYHVEVTEKGTDSFSAESFLHGESLPIGIRLYPS